MTDDSATTWHKSSYSNGSGGNCVEVAAVADTWLVRDSKDLGRLPLAISGEGWAAFMTALREGGL